MTVHWIDQATLTRKKSVLACRRLKGRHTYDILAKEISDIHWDFQIDEKVIMTTTDNGSNFVKAFTWVFLLPCLVFARVFIAFTL